MISESASIYAAGLFGVITELYVVPEKRSAGIAKLLIDATVALGRERWLFRVDTGRLLGNERMTGIGGARVSNAP
jgi:GNAT superfamily N-acetyltransferase